MSRRYEQLNGVPESTIKSSKPTINISGFHVHLYGVDELSSRHAKDTIVFFHVHGRTRSYKDGEVFAHQLLFQLKLTENLERGFVVATFDTRNHGERRIDSLSVEDWKGGNNKHAHDMLAMIDGNVSDIRLVMKYLELYVQGRFIPTEFIMTGFSLGGHTAWDALVMEPEMKAAVIIVGSPNLTDLLIERLGDDHVTDSEKWSESIAAMCKARDQNLTKITGKNILILNGALDTLVPSKFTLSWVEQYGSYNDVCLNIFQNTGHWLSLEMIDTTVEWILQNIA
ncbi:Alpha/Beta hydrolase protein [Penicillium atrosanguineum]|uniref:Alpha/Beta hydrolase protein n=1 Tax=Penicillium atrosanguineum TaxID=1132637 RepID=A0A9W9U5G4_9EURO|nr:Alpha/Beta hydrolase protein [Penicillium atrosanguineum]